MLESEIERRLESQVRKAGGLCFKFVSPGSPGVPDRIVITPQGRAIFVELKTDTGRLRAVQRYQISELRCRGAEVRVLYGRAGVDDFLREVFRQGGDIE